MPELRIDLRREKLFQPLDFFGDFAEARGVPLGIAPTLFITDNGEPLPEGGGELG